MILLEFQENIFSSYVQHWVPSSIEYFLQFRSSPARSLALSLSLQYIVPIICSFLCISCVGLSGQTDDWWLVMRNRKMWETSAARGSAMRERSATESAVNESRVRKGGKVGYTPGWIYSIVYKMTTSHLNLSTGVSDYYLAGQKTSPKFCCQSGNPACLSGEAICAQRFQISERGFWGSHAVM